MLKESPDPQVKLAEGPSVTSTGSTNLVLKAAPDFVITDHGPERERSREQQTRQQWVGGDSGGQETEVRL